MIIHGRQTLFASLHLLFSRLVSRKTCFTVQRFDDQNCTQDHSILFIWDIIFHCIFMLCSFARASSTFSSFLFMFSRTHRFYTHFSPRHTLSLLNLLSIPFVYMRIHTLRCRSSFSHHQLSCSSFTYLTTAAMIFLAFCYTSLGLASSTLLGFFLPRFSIN